MMTERAAHRKAKGQQLKEIAPSEPRRTKVGAIAPITEHEHRDTIHREAISQSRGEKANWERSSPSSRGVRVIPVFNLIQLIVEQY
jgi:hypothetical protein